MSADDEKTACPQCGRRFPGTVRMCPIDGTVLEHETATLSQAGQVLDGKYRLDSLLAEGGMGSVYRATHVMLGKTVAIKLIKAAIMTSPEIVRRFQREARAATALNHPNIVSVYDLGQTPDGTLYIAMEFIDGPSLKALIQAGRAVPAARTISILRQVASALAVAHKHNIIHRDLKPHNIMLATASDGSELAKLVDFGIAKTFDEATQLTSLGSALGTPFYMSPEQIEGRAVDARSDLYALGIILYEMLVGEVPFADQSTPAVLIRQLRERPVRPSLKNPAVPPALEAIAMRCLEKDPEQRFQTADDFAAALHDASATLSDASSMATLPMNRAVTPSPEATIPMPRPAPGPTPAGVVPAIVAPPPPASVLPTIVAPPPPPASVVPTIVAPPRPPVSVAPAIVAPPPQPASAAPAVLPPPPQAAPVSSVLRADPATKPTVPAILPPAPQPAPAPQSSKSPVAALLAVAAVVVLAGAGYMWWANRQAPASTTVASTSGEVPKAVPAMAGQNEPARPAETGNAAAVAVSPTPAVSEPASAAKDAAAAVTKEPPAPSTKDAAAAPKNAAAAKGAPAPDPAAAPPPARSPAVASVASARTPSLPGASNAPAGAAAPARGSAPQPPAQAPGATIPENAAVAFRCAGAPEVCASLRSTVGDALEKAGFRSVVSADRADISITAAAQPVDERVTRQFGTTFATRSYSIELNGDAPRFGDAVSMPGPSTVSFDPSFGRERLDEKSRLIASEIVERVRAFIKKKRAP
jgi:serine/threonine protein kinase